jgi:hypothetical protein
VHDDIDLSADGDTLDSTLYICVYNILNCKKIKQDNLIRENSQEPFSDASVVTTVAISPGAISPGRLL